MFTLLCSNSPGLFGLAIWNSCSLTTPCFSLPAAPQQPPLHLLCLGLIILSIHINEIIYCLSFHDRPTSPYIASLCSSILCHVLEFFFISVYTFLYMAPHFRLSVNLTVEFRLFFCLVLVLVPAPLLVIVTTTATSMAV